MIVTSPAIARCLFALSVVLATVTVVSASPAHAAANDVFAVEPFSPEGSTERTWFVYAFQPGQIHQDIVTVRNLSDEPLNLVLYPSDGITIPGGGGFAPLREGEPPTGAGTSPARS